MSVIGPRPQLVRDMVFMTKEQRMRHTAKPGLSGLAQVNGRNAISWEDKIEWDLKYIEKVSFKEDLRIIFATVKKTFIKQEGITQDDMATAEDLGDYLMRTEKITQHPFNITINENVVIGNNCNIHKGVCIGQENRGSRKGVPQIGNCCWIGINAVIVGNIHIGDDVLIAPNAYVNCDIPSHSICKIKEMSRKLYNK